MHRGGHDSQAEHFGEEEREHQASESPKIDFEARDVHRLVNGVIRRIAGPARSKAEDTGSETQNATGFAVADAHGDVGEGAAVREFSEHDQEDYEAGQPRVVFVGVHHFIAEKCDEKCCGCDDDDAGPARKVGIDCIQELSADDYIDGGPTYARKDVENGDYE